MIKMKKIYVVMAILMIAILLSGCTKIQEYIDGDEKDSHPPSDDEISIACWNLQIFGTTKASKTNLIDYYGEKLDEYDIFIVQEIRDSSGTAIQTLAKEFPNHDYILSERAGQSSSKEQYAVFYNNEVELDTYKDWTSSYQEQMQRPPLEVRFDVTNGDWDFTLYTIHTSPSSVDEDLDVLEDIIGSSNKDVIILGDLNADGSYYDEDNIQHFMDWKWVVTNSVDTTVALSDNTYDRIIINDKCENNYINFGVMDDVDKDQSDHYLVYAIFDPSEE